MAVEPGGASPASAGDTWRFAALCLTLTLVLAYPLTVDPARRVLADGPDTRAFIWALEWDTHAFTHQPLSIFDANIYHPERHTLAYSENLIGSALIAAPVLWLTHNSVLALNVVALLSCVLCGLGAYVLGRRLGMGPPAAALCGIIFAFSPPRFFRLSQLHLTTIQWVPFGLASLHAYFDRAEKSDIRLAVAFFMLQALTSGHGAALMTVAMLGLVVYRVALGEPLAMSQRLKDVGVPGVLLFVPALLVTLPYRAVQGEIGLSRSLDDWISNWGSFLASPSHVQTFLLSLVPDARINETAQAYLFPGYLPLLLVAAAFCWPRSKPTLDVAARRASWWTRAAVLVELLVVASLAVSIFATVAGPIRWKAGSTVLFSVRGALRPWLFCLGFAVLRLALVRRAPFDVRARLDRWRQAFLKGVQTRRHDMRAFYGLLAVFCLWLAAGPPGGLWPLVYWLPGLSFIRVPSRFGMLALLALAVLAGMGFERLSASATSKTRAALATIAGLLLVIEFAAIPLRTVPYHVEIPGIDRWLDGRPKPFAIAEVPLENPANLGARERRHTDYMLHSMAHWQKTIEGYSGLRPPLHEEVYAQLEHFPDERSLRSLVELGVDYVVVHTDLYPPGEWPRVDERIGLFERWLTLQREEGAGRVYSLRAPADGVVR